MRHIIISVLAAVLSGCGAPDLSPFSSLASREPHVVMVEPANNSRVGPNATIAVEFSEAIDPISVNKQTLAIVKAGDSENSADDLVQSISDGKTEGIDGAYEFQTGWRALVFRASEPYESGATYSVVATNKIMSVEMLPLNQRPGRTPAPFVSGFFVEGENQSEDAEGGGDGSGSESEDGADGGGNETVLPPAGPERPASFVISEILYDIVGDDTNGQVFVELLGDAETDVSGYKLIFVNGEDGKINETLEFPANSMIDDDGIFLVADSKTGQAGVSNVAGADFIPNFDPQNGPDCVQLVNEKGELIDALGYGTPIAAAAENGLACFEGTPAVKATSGKSLSRADGLDTDNNSADFTMPAAPTPGVR